MHQIHSMSLSILWIYDGDLSRALDKATWISTTRALRNLGCYVDLVCMGNEKHTTIEGIQVRSLSAPSIYFIGKLIFHIKIIADIFKNYKQYEFILFHPQSGLFLLPLIFIRSTFHLSRPLFVVDIRTAYMPSSAETNWRMGIRRIYFQIMQWLFNRYIDGQTVITRRLAAYYHIPPNKLWGVWESGVDLEKFQPSSKKRDWTQIDKCVHLIYIGTLNDGRNVGVFCQAVINRNKVGEKYFFTVIGSGFEQEMIAHFSELYPDIIQYLPPIPHNEVPDWLAKAHLGVLPFPNEVKFQVSSPIKLFEYMASGLPIIATRIVCHTDVVQEDDFVFWAENSSVSAFEDILKQIWEKRFMLPELSLKAAVASGSWSWLESAKKLQHALFFGLEQNG